ncbi:MAG: hypothetical protein MUP48_00405 [Wolbachia endosymbiont of Homalodisca vitripennis]|nr:hypothetical protein [Wolbachia endosymbiont of Homalodisca vitripennis]MCJ7453919.1 hypothetical protein [Wolbachia endosymbiont of Homalodisca vitripennis]MCJ7475629.1 hypothetical protein [Wolbachia endosymbiont of Homalodisca vitripennis]
MDNDTKAMLFILGIATSIGALAGLGLSFTTLSPLVMGGIVASVPAALFSIIIYNQNFSKKNFFIGACLCAASFATGVGLAAATMAIFPGATLGIGSAALAGAVIGVIAPIAAFCATAATKFAAEKVSEYIISPIVEKVKSCFSSKEEGNGLVR